MCGVMGLVYRTPTRPPEAQVRQWLTSLAHRGPDGQGVCGWGPDGLWESADAAPPHPVEGLLLHRRLAVLDLTAAAHQPMISRDRRYALILNGEIYNYIELRRELEARGQVFQSHSDTEVLLAAWLQWGSAVLPRLVGMFAFAVLDTVEQRLFLARDPFGIKPLYYAAFRDGWAFASEIKALLELPGVNRSVHRRNLAAYVSRGWTDHNGDTLFAAVRQLPAAHYLEWALAAPGRSDPVRYWALATDARAEVSFEEAARRTRELFLEAVDLHLRSDVPVGACLSGGVDSSAIVSAMRLLRGERLELHAFSFVPDDPALDERRWSDCVIQATRAHRHTIAAEAPDARPATWERLTHIQDEPFGGTSVYGQYRVFERARQSGIKVLLDGQGADELLGGYPAAWSARAAALARAGQPGSAWRLLRSARVRPGGWGLAAWLALPQAVQTGAHERLERWLWPEWLDRRWLDQASEPALYLDTTPGGSLLKRHLRHLLATSSLPRLLHWEDRNSMAFSLESRTPFLTTAFADFILSLPDAYLVDDSGLRKAVFRAAMRGIVPDAVLERRDKIGFATPMGSWMMAARPWVTALLHSETARRIPAIRIAAADREWQAVCAGRRPFDDRFWRCLNLIVWARQCDVVFD